MNWYIGQKVYYLLWKKVVTIAELGQCNKCKTTHIGILEDTHNQGWVMHCSYCDGGCGPFMHSGTDEKEFRPLEDDFAEQTLEYALEGGKELEQIQKIYNPEKEKAK